MEFTFVHNNFNVRDLEASLAFYRRALDLVEARRFSPPDGGFIIVYLTDGRTPFALELTWLRDHPQPYDLGEAEFHLAFEVAELEAAREKHRQMGCICFENPELGIYFIEDPDGYWLEIVPARPEKK